MLLLTTIPGLSLFFTDNGIENDVIIPTRDEGYGLHAEKVIEAFQNKFYDLVITVDCGISNREEVAKIKSPFFKFVRGKGLLNAIITEPQGEVEAWDVCLALAEKGLLAKPTHRHIIRFAPPLTINEEQLREAIAIIKDVFENMPYADNK